MSVKNIRCAWIIKENPSYCYGDWKEIKELNKLKKWIKQQNEIYSETYYWVEYITVKDEIKNFITTEIEVAEYVLLES